MFNMATYYFITYYYYKYIFFQMNTNAFKFCVKLVFFQNKKRVLKNTEIYTNNAGNSFCEKKTKNVAYKVKAQYDCEN